MKKQYKILYFHPNSAQIGVKFDGLDCYNYRAPFKDGSYISGDALDDYIQTLYPYSQEELQDICEGLSGAEHIQSLVVVNGEGA